MQMQRGGKNNRYSREKKEPVIWENFKAMKEWMVG